MVANRLGTCDKCWPQLVLSPAKGWLTGAAGGWRAAYPKLTNLLGSILAKLWWRTTGVLGHISILLESANNSQYFFMFLYLPVF